MPLGWLKAGWEQPCFFNIFKQDLSKIEFECYILDQHKKCFKMRPNKTMLAIIWFWPKLAPSGVRRGGGTLPVAGLEPLPQLFLCDFYHPRDQSQLLKGETCNSSEIVFLTSPLLMALLKSSKTRCGDETRGIVSNRKP